MGVGEEEEEEIVEHTRTGQGKATDALRLISALNFFILPLRLNTATYLLLKSIVPSCIFAQEEVSGDGNLDHPQTNRDALLPTLFVRAGRSAGLRKSFDK